jgi:two-component system, OmpR family, phosphate regulon response regulator PhoB
VISEDGYATFSPVRSRQVMPRERADAGARRSSIMATILIVEDEADLRQVIEFNLEAAGHRVLTASTGAEGLKIAEQAKPDLVLLDIMLPDITGLDVCRQLKTKPDTKGIAVVMLTARAEEIDRVVGFELGADDYVVKPFSVRELSLRISAILRRSETSVEPESVVRFGILRLDREGYRAWVDDQEIELTALEFNLLMTLYDRKDRVQSRSVLLEDVWGMSADVTTRTVDTHVKRLREKLVGARDYIETVRGVGYRFVGKPEDAGK